MERLLRLTERKYADSPCSSPPANGGPQWRVSSPRSGCSTLRTSAPSHEHHRSVWSSQDPREGEDLDAFERQLRAIVHAPSVTALPSVACQHGAKGGREGAC